MSKNSIAIGDVVVLTELGKKRHPRLHGRSATVQGRSRSYGRTWIVQFEGNLSPQAIHESYIEVDRKREGTEQG